MLVTPSFSGLMLTGFVDSFDGEVAGGTAIGSSEVSFVTWETFDSVEAPEFERSAQASGDRAPDGSPVFLNSGCAVTGEGEGVDMTIIPPGTTWYTICGAGAQEGFEGCRGVGGRACVGVIVFGHQVPCGGTPAAADLPLSRSCWL